MARIGVAPLIAWLPFIASPWLRLGAFVLFIAAAVTDYFDGRLARSRNMVTDLGRLLDPLADKLLLLATIFPMFFLMAPRDDAIARLFRFSNEGGAFPFATPAGDVGLPWWIIGIILGREVFMTIFRQAAARRGVVISAISSAKWKTGFQSTWVGAAFFWFFALTMANAEGWSGGAWTTIAHFVGIVGVVTMLAAVVMALYSLWLYVSRFGSIFR